MIIPFLLAHIDDAERHNLRAAFLAGICHGFDRQTLLLQLPTPGLVQPADFRDLVTTVRNEFEIREVVELFATSSILATQSIVERRPSTRRSQLQTLSLGARAAENEFRSLEQYFVETAEFLRTLRGDAQVVTGRKGSGKTAIFFMVRDRIRDQKNSIVTDLKPESHQLSLFREELLKLVDVGVFDHTLAAFWQFVILTEVLFAIRREQTFRSKFDSKALQAEAEIDEVIHRYRIGDTGDFTFRISRLGDEIVQEIQRLRKTGSVSAQKLTNIIFRGAVADIRSLIAKYTTGQTKVVLLFDNIDKGWPANGVDRFDARLVRLLLESLEKLRSDLATHDRLFIPVVFLRNDIYELLLDETPDRGKTAEVRIDWTDRVKLRQVIYRRLQSSVQSGSETFQQLWERFFVSRVGTQEAIEFFIDHCLMRPRFLINIVENAISNGINRVHDVVSEEDCIDAVAQHASYLMDDFGYEIRDVSGMSADILYALKGIAGLVTRSELVERFRARNVADPIRAFDLMLWYGLLGIAESSGSRYIYDYDYNLKRLEAGLEKDDTLYAMNPAIAVALS